MQNKQHTPLMKFLIALQTMMLPIQIIILKQFFDFNTGLYFIISLPYFIYILLMKVKIDVGYENTEKLLEKIQQLEDKIDKQNNLISK